MLACGQSVDRPNKEQTELYLRLMLEEVGETLVAANPSRAAEIRTAINLLADLATLSSQTNRVELFDGLLDVIVTATGAGISAALPLAEGWKEVFRSNMAKVDPETGAVRRRDDGKVLKPEGWTPPNLAAILEQAYEHA
ncbi:Phosphoribosyl-ATP pyrophosphohydrolase [Caballeronia pedi]|uniref:Phosphoribosyl-ATP pyrophosphohydrolase n=2 Tax=Caballeronia pedi TaxID=1777141 RepID=A0A158DXU0_9BURK|nr:Phosphoribosyl-ATP pyrophosphohydrolase [Caballeronia pedi]